jgi:hypothetical protein
MNMFMNKVALHTFSSFDSGNKPSEDAEPLEDTVANAHRQIQEKQYETELIAAGFLPEQIRKYSFAFRGKECLIG